MTEHQLSWNTRNRPAAGYSEAGYGNMEMRYIKESFCGKCDSHFIHLRLIYILAKRGIIVPVLVQLYYLSKSSSTDSFDLLPGY